MPGYVPQSRPMWLMRVSSISKMQRKGVWGHMQNKVDNPGSPGLSGWGGRNQGAWTSLPHSGRTLGHDLAALGFRTRRVEGLHD